MIQILNQLVELNFWNVIRAFCYIFGLPPSFTMRSPQTSFCLFALGILTMQSKIYFSLLVKTNNKICNIKINCSYIDIFQHALLYIFWQHMPSNVHHIDEPWIPLNFSNKIGLCRHYIACGTNCLTFI